MHVAWVKKPTAMQELHAEHVWFSHGQRKHVPFSHDSRFFYLLNVQKRATNLIPGATAYLAEHWEQIYKESLRLLLFYTKYLYKSLKQL